MKESHRKGSLGWNASSRRLTIVWLLLFSTTPAEATPNSQVGSNILPHGIEAEVQAMFDLAAQGTGGELEASTIDIQPDKIRACFGEEDATWCVLLVHPSAKREGDFPAGEYFAIRPVVQETMRTEAIVQLAEVIQKHGSDWWSASKFAQDGYSSLTWVGFVGELLRQGEVELSREALSLLLQEEQAGPELWAFQAVTAALLGDMAGAERALEEIEEQYPLATQQRKTAEAMVNMLAGELQEGLLLEGVRSIFEDLDEEEACLVVERASSMLRQRAFSSRARLLLEAANSYHAGCLPLLREKGQVRQALGHFDLAVESFQIAYSQAPSDQVVVLALTENLRILKRHREVLTILEKLYDSAPEEHRDLISYYATTAAYVKQSDPLVDSLRLRHIENPSDLLAPTALAILGYYQGRYEEVVSLTDDLRDRLPDNDRVWVYGAMSRYALGDVEAAQQWLEATPLHPGRDTDIEFCKAVVWYDEDPHRAVHYMEEYLAHPVRVGDSVYKRATATKMLGQMKRGERLTDFLPPWKQRDELGRKVTLFVAWTLILFLALFFIRKRFRRTR